MSVVHENVVVIEHIPAMTPRPWEIVDVFVANAVTIHVILNSVATEDTTPAPSNIADIVKLTHDDPIYEFAIQLLVEECKCRHGGTRFADSLAQIVRSFPAIDVSLHAWFEQIVAGLVCEPFPTVEELLKRQGRPSIFVELHDIFAGTRLLNRLACHFNPNDTKRTRAQHLICLADHVILHSLSDPLRRLLQDAFPSLHLPTKRPALTGGSFKELLRYVDLDASTVFRSLPMALLEPNEGSDANVPFGRRLARRTAAKFAAWEKIHFDPVAVGTAPRPETAIRHAINFNVQLPDTVDPNLVHQNVFEAASLADEFVDSVAFSVSTAHFLQITPAVLTGRLKNTDIFLHAPNETKTPSGRIAAFNGLLLALGLRGHLTQDALPPVDIHEVLSFNVPETSACLFLGVAASAALGASRDNGDFLRRLYSMHLASFQLAPQLDIPPLLQLSAALSLGLQNFRSFNRGIAQLLVSETCRPLALNVNNKSIDTPLLSFVPALALGMILMGGLEAEHANDRAFAEDILVQLRAAANGSGQHQVALLMAHSLIAIDASSVSTAPALPWIRNLNELLGRSEQIVFWCILAGRLRQWSRDLTSLEDQGEDAVQVDFVTLFAAVCRPSADSVWTLSAEIGLFVYGCSVLTANALFVALRYAGGTVPVPLLASLDGWIERIRLLPILHNTDPDYFLTKIQTHLLTTFQYLLLARSVVFSGTGEVLTWRLLREQFAHPLLFKYGNARLFHSSLGFLFLAGGRGRICTVDADGGINHFAVAGLLAALLPLLPTTITDPDFSFLSLMSPLWTLAVKPA